MNKAAIKARVIETLTEMAGGGAAGYVDAKYAGKTVGSGKFTLTYGQAAALGAVAAGIFGAGMLPGKVAHYAFELGGGMAAYETGKLVKERVQKGSSPGVKGVGALPPARRAVSEQEIHAALTSLTRG